MNKPFYPLLRDYLKEASKTERVTDEEIRASKLEDLDEVINPKTKKKIDMKALKFEMESAKNAIVAQSPLFAPYVHEFDPVIYTWLVDTMGTDGIRLFVNPEFATSLTWEQKIFVIIHEIMHCVLIHQERGVGYNHDKFNRAGDYEINIIIADQFDKEFPVKFIQDMHGLIDEKWLNIPAEQIYREIPDQPDDNKPKKGPKGKDQEGQGGSGKIEVYPGMKVRLKSNGKVGIVKKIQNGEYFIDEIVDEHQGTVEENLNSFYPRLLQIFENTNIPGQKVCQLPTIGSPKFYDRDEFIPILKRQKSGGGGGQPSTPIKEPYELEGEGDDPTKGEGQGQGQSGEQKDQKGQSGSGGGGQGQGKMVEFPEKSDPGQCGSIIPKEVGDKIARASGYSDKESKADQMPDWKHNGRKLLADAKKLGDKEHQKGRGTGGGSALLKTLGRLYNTDINWKNTLRRYIATALSPEEETRIPNRRHIGRNPDFPWRIEQRQKQNALEKAFVCVDVSGSMSSKTLNRIANEVCSLLHSQKVNEVIVISFDGVVQQPVQVIKMGQKEVEIIVTHGGTDFQAPLDYIQEYYHDNVSVCILFSDGDCPPPTRPKYWRKFIWIIYDDPDWVQPWGRLIKAMSNDM